MRTPKHIKSDKPIVNNKRPKSFFKNDGLKYNEAGLQASDQMSTAIMKMYTQWLDKGYSPSECREMLLSSVWVTTTFVNAMRS